jgi:hypothetical protein
MLAVNSIVVWLVPRFISNKQVERCCASSYNWASGRELLQIHWQLPSRHRPYSGHLPQQLPDA